MQLDQNTSKPFYKQLEEILIHRIETGVWAPGSKIPTEAELVEEFQVSRVTVRKSLEALTKNFLLERKSGKGTFVAAKRMQRNISQLLSFTNFCQMQGLKPDAKTIRIDYDDPTEDEQQKMKLDPGKKIIVLERLRYADDIPVSIELTKFPENFSFLFNIDLNHNSLYKVLEKYGITLTKSAKILEIQFADYRESKLLNIPKKHPLLCISSIVSDINENNINLSRQICVADKFKIIV
jgi:GntR family transcriptional regulator